MVGPFKFVGECGSPSLSQPYINTRVEVAPEGRPHSGGASVLAATGSGRWANTGDEAISLMGSYEPNSSGYVTGYIYSPGNNPGTVEKGVTFHLYQNRSTHPTLGTLCTFSGYVVEDV